MKNVKQTVAIWLLLLAANVLQAQGNIKLFAEGKDEKNIRLLWLLKDAKYTSNGFWICKKQNNRWLPLNKQPILPAIQNQLGETGLNAFAQQELQQKLSKWLTAKKLQSTSHTQFAARIQNDTGQLKALTLAIVNDFDFALITGFAWVDASSNNNEVAIEYGLFSGSEPSFTHPLTTCMWKKEAEKVQPFRFPLAMSAKIRSDKNGVQIIWQDTAHQMQADNLIGFRIYRKNAAGWDLLNKQYLIPLSKNGTMQYLDVLANIKLSHQYAIVPVTITGMEGAQQLFTYQSALFPTQYTAPKIKEATIDQEVNGWTTIHWDFPLTQEMYVKAFQVYEAVPPAQFVKVGQAISATKRQTQVKVQAQAGSYVQYKVMAIYNDETTVGSDEKLLYYLPYLASPKPVGVQAAFVKNGNEKLIQISWKEKAAADTLTKGYQLYVSNPYDGKMYLADRPELIKGNQIQYPIYSTTGAAYKICIASVNKFNQTGTCSDTIEIKTPSFMVPQPVIYPYSQDSGKVTLHWKYAKMADLKGFRVYQNGHLVANEHQLNSDATTFTTPQLKKGITYSFTIQAVLKDGTESEKSFAKELYIFTTAKSK